jgi:GMP synthase-like glutamine amidotransferase
MRILVLQHESEAPAGLLAEWAQERGHALRVLDVPRLERWPAAGSADAVISLGSESSVERSREPWIEQELGYLREAHAARLPLLGICFGAQALAAALGGRVARAPRIAVEWSAPEVHERALIPEGAWLRWHEDVFSVPPGAREIASVRGVPMGFIAGRSIALQFHPEADAQIAHGWIAAARQQLRGRAEDLLAVEQALEREGEEARGRAFELFDRVVRRWSEP